MISKKVLKREYLKLGVVIYEFDLVITDMTMPQMNGTQLSKELRKIQSDIPIIICTGHSSFMNEKKKAKQLGIEAASWLSFTISKSRNLWIFKNLFIDVCHFIFP